MSDNRDRYREAAKRILKAIPGTDVELHANVHEMQTGGAFVECIVWVPADAIAETLLDLTHHETTTDGK